MNADEADAESLFAGIKDDDGFVRFVVEAVHDAEDVAGFDELVAGYAEQLGRRDTLMAEAAFARAASAVLSDLGGTGRTGERPASGAVGVELDAARLRSQLDAGVIAAQEAERAARDEAVETARHQRAVGSQADRAGSIASELRRIEADLLHQRAKQAEDDARAVVDEARLRVAGVAGGPRQPRPHRARRRGCPPAGGAGGGRQRDLVPLRARAEADEARLAARLSSEALTLEATIAARQAAGDSDELAARLDLRSRAAVGETARLKSAMARSSARSNGPMTPSPLFLRLGSCGRSRRSTPEPSGSAKRPAAQTPPWLRPERHGRRRRPSSGTPLSTCWPPSAGWRGPGTISARFGVNSITTSPSPAQLPPNPQYR